jgi:hypothetical protein
MATVPGTPDNVIGIHPAFRPTQADFLQAAAIMHQQGKFDDQQDRGTTIGDVARRWQGFESRFPKEQHYTPQEMIIKPQVIGKEGWT